MERWLSMILEKKGQQIQENVQSALEFDKFIGAVFLTLT